MSADIPHALIQKCLNSAGTVSLLDCGLVGTGPQDKATITPVQHDFVEVYS